MPKVVIVVPCYNEHARLAGDVFQRYAQAHPDIGFLFVDDGSTDGTASLLRSVCEAAPAALRCLTLEHNRGKAEAVRRGMLDAFDVRGARYAGFWDADLSTPLEAISTFVDIQEAYPQIVLVMGARVQLLGRTIVRDPARHYSGRVFATAASALLSIPVYDTQCGAKLFRVDKLSRAVFQRPFVSRWIFDVEILARLLTANHSAANGRSDDLFYELPLMEWNDVSGSKRKARDYFLAARDLYRIHRRYRRDLRDVGAPAPTREIVAGTPTNPSAKSAKPTVFSEPFLYGARGDASL